MMMAMLILFVACGRDGEHENISDVQLYEETLSPTNEPSPPVGEIIANSPGMELAWSTAQDFWDKFTTGDFSAAIQLMTAEMQTIIGEQTLQHTHQSILTNSGSFIKQPITLMDANYVGGAYSFQFMSLNTTAFSIYQMMVSDSGEVEAFWIIDSGFNPAPISDNATFFVETITIGAGTPWALDGALTMPNNASESNPVPAVVLVHGSGAAAGDMDASLFNNRPFWDIAEHLSSNGIAVIRYHKRTFSHASALMQTFPDNLTVWEETVEDALLAADILRNDTRIDSDRIFMLGLSMGGMLAPRIHLEGGNFAGIILIGSTPESFTDTIVRQNLEFINTIEDDDMRNAFVDQLDATIELFDALQYFTAEQARALPFDGGATFYYLRDFNMYSFKDLIDRVHIPFLILHGERDYQTPAHVTIPLFEEIFSDRDNVTMYITPGLNHILTPWNATGLNEVPGDATTLPNVTYESLRQISNWILEQ